MSTENKAAATLPPLEHASAVAEEIYGRRFFAKMASLGWAPQNEAQAISMLETAPLLDNVPLASQKSASADPFQQAQLELQQLISAAGPGGVKQAEVNERQKLAYELASRPELYLAMLSLKAAEAAAANGQEVSDGSN